MSISMSISISISISATTKATALIEAVGVMNEFSRRASLFHAPPLIQIHSILHTCIRLSGR